MSVKDAVAERFLEILKERKITVNELANRSGVTPSTAYSMFDKKKKRSVYNNNKKVLRRARYVTGRILFGRYI